jgi:hypothetical protein
MSNHLRSCVNCRRHIRIAETKCPFCATAVPAERRSPPPRGNVAARLGRAFAMSTVAATGGGAAIAACTNDTAPVVTAGDAYGIVEPTDSGLHDARPDEPLGMGAGDAQPDVTTGGDAQPDVTTGSDAQPDVVTGGDAYGTVEPTDSSLHDVVTGGDAYGTVEPTDSGLDGDAP